MRVLVTGGRNFDDYGAVSDALHLLDPTVVIVGDANGADTLAYAWCCMCGVPCVRFYADWNTHGRAAGPIRNQRMLDEGKPDVVLAFAGGRGTADMVRRAEAAGVPVKRPDDTQEW